MLLVSATAHSQICQDRGPNVILFTWDGVRNQEFFRGTGALLEHSIPKSERGEILKEFWKNHAEEGVVLGGNGRYKIGSKVSVSLPSYQAIMMGKPTSCRKNNCAPVSEETVLEKIRTNLKLDKKDVAVFASWNRMIAAIAQYPDTLTHGIFPEKFTDGSGDSFYDELFSRSMTDLPEWPGSRKDEYTFELAMHYLKKNCPRVLYISLVDSDEFAHKGNYGGYIKSLRAYDSYLSRLISFLDDQGAYGKNTTLFVTTDHSRGSGPLWRGHGHTTFTEKNIFLYMRGRGVEQKGRVKASGNHLLLRPTLEKLMGIDSTGETLPGVQF